MKFVLKTVPPEFYRGLFLKLKPTLNECVMIKFHPCYNWSSQHLSKLNDAEGETYWYYGENDIFISDKTKLDSVADTTRWQDAIERDDPCLMKLLLLRGLLADRVGFLVGAQKGSLNALYFGLTEHLISRWDEKFCENASHAGQFETLKWLRKHGFLWDKWVIYWAEIKKHKEIHEWSLANGCPKYD